MNKIHFGTDGWRGIIGENFIHHNLRRIAVALSKYLAEEKLLKKKIHIGYDNRFLSEQAADTIAKTLVAQGAAASVSNESLPTPALSFITRQKKSPVGIMITASHNPFYYNGLKFKLDYGGPAMPVFTSAIEKLIPQTIPDSLADIPDSVVKREDYMAGYLRHIKNYINFSLLKRANISIVSDSMHGSGKTIVRDLLKDTKIKVISLRNNRDAFFGGSLPEPILNNLKEASRIARSENCSLVLATDGDADRIGVLDSRGGFVELHYLMPLLYEYLRKSRGWKGGAVRTTSADNIFDAVVAEYGEKIIEVPVGFKNVCEQVLQNDILVGGEESGGIYVKKHIPERDGILLGLLTLEMVISTGRKIEELVADLERRFWKIHYLRTDRHSDMTRLKGIMKSLRENPPDKLGTDKIEHTSIIDGVKFYFKNGGWLLFRLSDTEPLGRIYTAARDPKTVRRLMKNASEMIFGK